MRCVSSLHGKTGKILIIIFSSLERWHYNLYNEVSLDLQMSWQDWALSLLNCVLTIFYWIYLKCRYVICQIILNFPSHFLKVEFQMSLITSLDFTKGFFRDRKSRVFFTHTCACLDTYGAINFWFHCNMGELYGSKNCWTEK